MASFKSLKFGAPQFMPGDGCAVSLTDKAVIATAPVVNDTIDFTIPAGIEIAQVELQCDDLDTNGTPLMAFSVGYAPIDRETQLTAAPTYFAPAGQATMRTGGRYLCAFKPIKFDEDVILRVTIGAAAATFAAGEVHAIVIGAARGIA